MHDHEPNRVLRHCPATGSESYATLLDRSYALARRRAAMDRDGDRSDDTATMGGPVLDAWLAHVQCRIAARHRVFDRRAFEDAFRRV